ncbi:HAD family phosphatase [Kitasatospora sp. NPDC085895]|uniref:HAD family hydrolase n=1 Tax=Kitasatospora sp. NPDC085895 TaxID=3155057 RepID=UPI003450AC1E
MTGAPAGVRTALRGVPSAVLVDMDGTLVDTEDLWWQTEVALFAEWGHRLDEKARGHVTGGPMERVVEYLLRTTGVDIGPSELAALIGERFLRRLDEQIPLMPGAVELLSLLADSGIPVALVTASRRDVADLVLAALGRDRFAVSVSGDDVRRNKPCPDPYVAAATDLGAQPRHCVAVEDSITGVLAAEAAGCPVIVVPSVAPIAHGPGRTVLPSLHRIDLELLQRLVR